MGATKPLHPLPTKKYQDEKVDVTKCRSQNGHPCLQNLKDVFIDTCTCHVLGKQITRHRLRRFETFDFVYSNIIQAQVKRYLFVSDFRLRESKIRRVVVICFLDSINETDETFLSIKKYFKAENL